MIFSFFATLSIGSFQPLEAADCPACGAIFARREAAAKEEASNGSLLAANQNALAAISPSDISKKVKISSNILILTARAEKAGNDKTLIDQDFNAKGCQTCPK